MLLHSERLTLRCQAPSVTVAEALRAAGLEWRESKLSTVARAAHILGWRVRIHDSRIVVRARLSSRNSFVPHFVGSLSDTNEGSVLVGELRLSWFPRLFMLIWLFLTGGAPLIGLLEGVPGGGIGEHVFAAWFMLLPGIALFSFGLWIAQRSWAAPAAAFKDFLAHSCAPPNVAAPRNPAPSGA